VNRRADPGSRETTSDTRRVKIETVVTESRGAYTVVVDPGSTLTGSVALRLCPVVHDNESIATDGTPLTVHLQAPG
jgi:hypothetical protein